MVLNGEEQKGQVIPGEEWSSLYRKGCTCINYLRTRPFPPGQDSLSRRPRLRRTAAHSIVDAEKGAGEGRKSRYIISGAYLSKKKTKGGRENKINPICQKWGLHLNGWVLPLNVPAWFKRKILLFRGGPMAWVKGGNKYHGGVQT